MIEIRKKIISDNLCLHFIFKLQTLATLPYPPFRPYAPPSPETGNKNANLFPRAAATASFDSPVAAAPLSNKVRGARCVCVCARCSGTLRYRKKYVYERFYIVIRVIINKSSTYHLCVQVLQPCGAQRTDG